MNAKTATERGNDRRARQKDAGLMELRNLWIFPEAVPEIKALAAKLNRKYAKEKTK